MAEIKLTWKALQVNNPQDIFVGKVKRLNKLEGGNSIDLEGRNPRSNEELVVTISEEKIVQKNSLSGLQSLEDIEIGDIIHVSEKSIRNIYRVNSPNNAIFATVRCNSNCLMCSQPPLDIDDVYENYLIWTAAIDMLPDNIPFIGVTGGEPTLMGSYLVEILNLLLEKYPDIMIDVLSNGRLAAKKETCDILSEIIDPSRVVFAIPLYSDIYRLHDHVVQSKDAFFQTIAGIHNLSKLGFLIEIRVVLHKLTSERLEQLSQYVHKNFPFIYHITFMGLELIGYTKKHKAELEITETENLNDHLERAIQLLSKWNYRTSIYNTPLCHLPENLRPFAKQSISDWKNGYL